MNEWTKETPKQDGWYWMRMYADDATSEVVHLQNGSVKFAGDGHWIVGPETLDNDIEWAGPLSFPGKEN